MNRGFTLVELSIVLVIVGLVVGGVLVGRDLIESARIRSQISQFERIGSASNTFRSKFNALAGDLGDQKAVDVGLFTVGGSGTHNNGIIDDQASFNTIHTPFDESLIFFYHLTQASLLEPSFRSDRDSAGACYAYSTATPAFGFYKPVLNDKSGLIALTASGVQWLYLGLANCSVGNVFFNTGDASGVIPARQAFILDQKLDDGIPSTGTVRAGRSRSFCPEVGTSCLDARPDTTAGQCVTTVAATNYNVADPTNQCRLLVRMP